MTISGALDDLYALVRSAGLRPYNAAADRSNRAGVVSVFLSRVEGSKLLYRVEVVPENEDSLAADLTAVYNAIAADGNYAPQPDSVAIFYDLAPERYTSAVKAYAGFDVLGGIIDARGIR